MNRCFVENDDGQCQSQSFCRSFEELLVFQGGYVMHLSDLR